MKKVVKLALMLIWMYVIFDFSAQPAVQSTLVSSGVSKTIYDFIKILYPPLKMSLSHFDTVYVPLIRKTAHFIEYFILGILVYINTKEWFIKRHLNISLLTCLVYACSDEGHQLFVAGRSGSLRDVLIDISGSFAGILLFDYLYEKCLKKQ